MKLKSPYNPEPRIAVVSLARFCLATLSILGAGPVPAQPNIDELNQLYAEPPADPAETPPPGWRGLIGVGVMSASRAVGDAHFSATPLVSLAYRDTVYWHGAQGGVWALRSTESRARLGIVARLRRGYDPDAAENLSGMERRKSSVEAGINGDWTADRWRFAAAFTKDVTGHSDGSTATATIARKMRVMERASVTFSATIERLDANLVDYYYGVKPAEATAERPAYPGRATTDFRVGASAKLALTQSIALVGAVGYTRYGRGITDSPIVTRNGAFSFLLGGGWQF